VPRTRPPYPEGFRREAIRLARLGDKPQRQLAKDLGISDVTLRNWIKQERAERGERPGGLSGDEREELAPAGAVGISWLQSLPLAPGRAEGS
jgi:transposase